MGLQNMVSDFFVKDPATKDKDNVLIVSVLFLTQEKGWISTKRDFGVDDHVIEFTRMGNQKLITTGHRTGAKFHLEFEAFGGSLAGATNHLKEKMTLDMNMFVDKSLQPINEELLRQKLNGLLLSIDNRIG
jgi:hypothetical protein